MSNSYSEAVTSNSIAPPPIPKTYYLVRREVNTAVNIKFMLFRDLTSYSCVETLKTEAARSFERLVLIAKYESPHS